MVKQIDDKAYYQGHSAFRKGASLRSLVAPILATEGQRPYPKNEEEQKVRDAEENARMSAILGFMDGALDKLRGKT